jgi:hypothetical protein
MKIDTSPVANAGYDRSVQTGDTVLLDGHSSYDTDGDVLQYRWKQISGQQVALDNENEVIASFAAENEGVYEFELTVSDDASESSDIVLIEITEKTIQLLSPSNGEVISSRPTLRWNGNGCDSFKVYMSRDGKQFYEVGTTTEENFTVRPLANLLFSTNKNNFSPIYWKVLGKQDGAENIWIESPTWQYYNIRKNILIDNFFTWLTSIINHR